jgi:superfamily II DNA or RNA helicase
MRLTLNPTSIEDYRKFLRIKQLPVYSLSGRDAWFPDEYAAMVGVATKRKPTSIKYDPRSFLFDYQRDIAAMALRKQRFAIFADCGLGKTIIYFEYARTILPKLAKENRGILILSPLMVIEQTVAEAAKWYGQDLPIERVESCDLQSWLNDCGGRIGITNYEALRNDVDAGRLGCLITDESSILKSHYGKYGQSVIRLGRGLQWKLAGTGTPAPNDRIEYANHAVFLDHFPTVNSFLAKYFINRGQTSERWELKPHAVEPFYRALSHWSIFVTNPATYGWKDNCESIPPIHVHVHDVDMTQDQHAAVRKATGGLFAVRAGGITTRSTFSKIAKGLDGSETLKFGYIKGLVDSWPDKSTIIWCWYNEEQDKVAALFDGCANIDGSTPHAKRLTLIDDFKAGRRKVLVSKPQVLGFGLNLQVATKQVFSSLIDSYEKYYQAVKRSNRYGSTEPLDVHIPVLDVERPMVENVLRKATMVQRDTEEQEAIFKRYGYTGA